MCDDTPLVEVTGEFLDDFEVIRVDGLHFVRSSGKAQVGQQDGWVTPEKKSYIHKGVFYFREDQHIAFKAYFGDDDESVSKRLLPR